MKKVNKTVDKRQKDIQKKLSAAILMLLVSSIMMVSSTYAWFTLSTAPEVTGIQTTIAGNGNLEIALANETTWQTPANIETSNGSNTVGKDINTFWGNLVDLSQGYGLDKITLYPAELSTLNDSTTVDGNLLRVPMYGEDGRVKELSNQVSAGVYTEDSYFGTTGFGVRGIGTATGMSDRQYAFRDAKNSLKSTLSAAKNGVKGSISNNGGVLGSIAIKHANENGTETYTETEIASIGTLLSDLLTVSNNVEKAIIASIDAYASSKLSGLEDNQYLLIGQIIRGLDIDDVTVTNKEIVVGENKIPLSDSIVSMITDYQDVSATILTANNTFADLTPDTGESYSWTSISSIFSTLMDSSNVTIKVKDGVINMNQVKDNIGAIMNYFMANGRIDIVLGAGSGVYYDLAKLVGQFDANVTVKNISYGDLKLEEGATANISTAAISAPWLPTIQNTVATEGNAPDSSDTETVKLTDLYGYAIDLMLRTNVDGNLLISDAAQRIYSESQNVDTMGGGSCMSFTSEVLAVDQMKSLMDAIRIVYMDQSGKILIKAGLDTANAYTTDDGLTANIKKLNGAEFATGADKDVIAEMKKNQVLQLTVLVYLDGNVVDNADVANDAESMTGKLNLQFASSSALVPMDYNELKQVQQQNQNQTPEQGNE